MMPKPTQTAGWCIAALLAVLLAGIIVLPTAASLGSPAFAETSASGDGSAPLQRPCRGHVYPARLMTEHPLYPQLLRLNSQIQRLSATSADDWRRDWHLPWVSDASLVFIGPELPRFGVDVYQGYFEDWERLRVQARPQPTGELAPDLQARLRWIERSLRTDMEGKLQAARYARDLELARKHAEIVREHQEALINADLLSPRTGPDGDAVPSQRRRILAKIEAEMAQQRQASQQRLAEYEAQVRHQAEAALKQAQQQLWDKMEKRLQTSVSSGSKIATRLSKHLSSFEAADYTADVLQWESDADSAFSQAAQQQGQIFAACYEAAGRRSAAALSRTSAKLSREIYRETVLAVRKSAIQSGIQVAIPPLEPVTGADLTENMRPLVRRMWQR